MDAAPAQQRAPGTAAGLLTTTNEAFDRVAMHAVRRELLEAQAARPACRCTSCRCRGRARTSNTNGSWAPRSPASSSRASRTSPSATCFSRTCAATARRGWPAPGSTPLFPSVEDESTADLARDDDRWRPRGAADLRGPADTRPVLRRTPLRPGRCWPSCRPAVDPCGERGEFHSFAYAGPMFTEPIRGRGRRVVDARRLRLLRPRRSPRPS